MPSIGTGIEAEQSGIGGTGIDVAEGDRGGIGGTGHGPDDPDEGGIGGTGVEGYIERVAKSDDAMLRRVAGGAAPNTCTLCEDVDC